MIEQIIVAEGDGRGVMPQEEQNLGAGRESQGSMAFVRTASK
jgi:hypothetical protein